MSTFSVRELGRGERAVVDSVFAGLSPHSRYLRFQSPLAGLTPEIRETFAAVDGTRHVAVAAFTGPDNAAPIGISRLIAFAPGRAELAIEVVDQWHRQGVGRRLLERLRDRAVDLGYGDLVAEVLAENHGARALLASVFPHRRTHRFGTNLTVVVSLRAAPTSRHDLPEAGGAADPAR